MSYMQHKLVSDITFDVFFLLESINCVAFSADSRYLITAGDSVVHVFQNVSWVKETVKRLKSQLQDSNVTGSMRKRLASELSSYEEDLKKLDN